MYDIHTHIATYVGGTALPGRIYERDIMVNDYIIFIVYLPNRLFRKHCLILANELELPLDDWHRKSYVTVFSLLSELVVATYRYTIISLYTTGTANYYKTRVTVANIVCEWSCEECASIVSRNDENIFSIV